MNPNYQITNGGVHTARAVDGNRHRDHVEKTMGTTLENPFNPTLDKNAQSRRSALLEVGLRAIQESPNRINTYSAMSHSSSIPRNLSLGAIQNNPALL